MRGEDDVARAQGNPPGAERERERDLWRPANEKSGLQSYNSKEPILAKKLVSLEEDPEPQMEP